jgi:hypothetical protein
MRMLYKYSQLSLLPAVLLNRLQGSQPDSDDDHLAPPVPLSASSFHLV